MSSSEIPYGTLDLMVRKTLDVMGASHGYGIASSLMFLHLISGVRPECYNRGRAASCPLHHRRVADVQRLRRVELVAVGAMYW
jgi:hypothetical protein